MERWTDGIPAQAYLAGYNYYCIVSPDGLHIFLELSQLPHCVLLLCVFLRIVLLLLFLSLSLSVSLFLSLYLSVCISFCLSRSVSVRLPLSVSLGLSVCLHFLLSHYFTLLHHWLVFPSLLPLSSLNLSASIASFLAVCLSV